jgi:putative transposase
LLQTSSVRDVERSKLLLQINSGLSNSQIREQTGFGREKVRHWRLKWISYESGLSKIELDTSNRYLAHDLEEMIRHYLSDAPRPGAPCTFTSEQYCQILGIALENPEHSNRTISDWTAREVALEAQSRGIVKSISSTQVGRFFKRKQSEAA